MSTLMCDRQLTDAEWFITFASSTSLWHTKSRVGNPNFGSVAYTNHNGFAGDKISAKNHFYVFSKQGVSDKITEQSFRQTIEFFSVEKRTQICINRMSTQGRSFVVSLEKPQNFLLKCVLSHTVGQIFWQQRPTASQTLVLIHLD